MRKLFSTEQPDSQWVQLDGEGYRSPVTGVIHRLESPASCGMPLGGIDTGCIDIETSGLLGFCTIFNSHVPRRGPLNLPFLGFSIGGQAWVLCDPAQTKPWEHLSGGKKHPADPKVCRTVPFDGAGVPIADRMQFGVAQPEVPVPHLDLKGVKTPREIHYWGHYPVVDLEFETDAPIGIALRAWSPFLPGEILASMMPAAVFEVHLRNTSETDQAGAVAFSFPGPTQGEAGGSKFLVEKVQGAFNGLYVKGNKAAYALGVIGREKFRAGGELGADGEAWARIEVSLPAPVRPDPYGMSHPERREGTLGASVAVDFSLVPGEEKVVRFGLTWHSPEWKGGGFPESDEGNVYRHMYARYYLDEVHTAFQLAAAHLDLLRRVLAWQEALYTDPDLPGWLQDVLINNFHLIPEDGLWAQALLPIGEWCPKEDGLWALIENPRGCPNIECGGNSYMGGMAVQYFFPQLTRSTLRGYKAYQYEDGASVWVFGGVTGYSPFCELTAPVRGYQVGQSPSYHTGVLYRYWMQTGDDDFLREYYPALKKFAVFTFTSNPAQPYGLISLPEYDQQESYESTPFKGMSSHVASIRLYHLKVMEKMAQKMGDVEFAEQCRRWYQGCLDLLEEHLWAGSYYLQHKDPASSEVSYALMGYQLDGEAMAFHDGLGEGVFPAERARQVLKTICEKGLEPWGARVWSNPSGGPVNPAEFDPGYWGPHGVHAPGALMLSIAYMYHGMKEVGLDLARRILENMICRQRWSWDMPILFRGDTGAGYWGNDYSQMMMCWVLPAGVKGKSLVDLVKPGELVDRILAAARGNSGWKVTAQAADAAGS